MDNTGKIKYWSIPAGALMKELTASENGLSDSEADLRLKQYGPNRFKKDENTVPIKLFLMQFKSPIVLIMIAATIISALTGDWIDSAIILAIVFASIILSFFQEYNASNAVEELQSKIQINTSVIRNGEITEIPTYKIVPGDIVYLSAGSLIPADGLILSYDSFHVNQSELTGEAFAVEKNTDSVPEDTNINARKNCVFMGTNVRSGKAKILVVRKYVQYGWCVALPSVFTFTSQTDTAD